LEIENLKTEKEKLKNEYITSCERVQSNIDAILDEDMKLGALRQSDFMKLTAKIESLEKELELERMKTLRFSVLEQEFDVMQKKQSELIDFAIHENTSYHMFNRDSEKRVNVLFASAVFFVVGVLGCLSFLYALSFWKAYNYNDIYAV